MMNITIPVLVDVLEAVRTVTEGILDLRIVVTNHLGNPNAEELSYTLDTNENYMNGEPYDLGLSISAWFIEHPAFPIGPYVPPTPSTNPADYPLTPAQFKAMIAISGYGTDVDNAIAAIPDAIDREVVRAKYLYSTSYRRDNPIIAMLQPAVGITDVELDALWMVAKDLTP